MTLASRLNARSGVHERCRSVSDRFATVDPEDPRWINALEPEYLSSTWFMRLAVADQVRFAVQQFCNQLDVGIRFERILTQGLSAWLHHVDPGSAEAAFALGEIAEEAEHSIVFAAALSHLGVVPNRDLSFGVPFPLDDTEVGARMTDLVRTAPHLFFLTVLLSEEALDFLQRQGLHRRAVLPAPLVELLEYHVGDERRHMAFAAAQAVEPLDRTNHDDCRAVVQLGRVLLDVLGLRLLGPSVESLPVAAVDNPIRESVRIARASATTATARTRRVVHAYEARSRHLIQERIR